MTAIQRRTCLLLALGALGAAGMFLGPDDWFGLDVGPVFDREITEVEVEIGVGDRLVLHTDGALKVQSDTGDEYGEARLYASIKQEAPKNSQAFVNFVGGTIDQFHLTTPQNDDITISTVKRLK